MLWFTAKKHGYPLFMQQLYLISIRSDRICWLHHSQLASASSGGHASSNVGAIATSHRVGYRYLLVRRQAVETRALTAACQLGTPQESASVAEAGAQRHGAVPRPAVKPPQTAGSGHGAGAERNRPGREGTGTGEPGGWPEPQDQTKHFATVETLHRDVE